MNSRTEQWLSVFLVELSTTDGSVAQVVAPVVLLDVPVELRIVVTIAGKEVAKRS